MYICQNCGRTPAYTYAQDNQYAQHRWQGVKCIDNKRHKVIEHLEAAEAFGYHLPYDLSEDESVVITSAQSDTAPNYALEALQFYAKKNKIKLVVIPFTYLNRGNPMYDQSEGHTWHHDIQPHLCSERFEFGDWVVLGDVSISPTRKMPLTGIAHWGKGKSVVAGHTRLHQDTIPSNINERAELALTTGCVTQMNYTATAAGKGGEFDHIEGGIRIYRDGRVRTLQCSGMEVCDLEMLYNAKTKKVTKTSVPAILMGDTHASEIDPLVMTLTYGTKGVVETLDPEIIIHGDIHSQRHQSKFDTHDPFQREKTRIQIGSVKNEIEMAREILKMTQDRRTCVLDSNHDRHLDEMIKKGNWKNMHGEDRITYLELALEWSRSIYNGESFSALQYLIGDLAEFIDCKSAFLVKGVDMTHHGDQGTNGSRGNANQFKRGKYKTTTGHTHSHKIVDGSHSCGTSSGLDLDYITGGLSGQTQGHSIVNVLGHQQPLIFRGGKW